MLGGDVVSAYVPDVGIQETLTDHGETFIWKLRCQNDCVSNKIITWSYILVKIFVFLHITVTSVDVCI